MLVWRYLYFESSFLHKELRKLHTRTGFKLSYPVWGHMPLSLYALQFLPLTSFHCPASYLLEIPSCYSHGGQVAGLGRATPLSAISVSPACRDQLVPFLPFLSGFQLLFLSTTYFFWCLSHIRERSCRPWTVPCLDYPIHNILTVSQTSNYLHSWVRMRKWAPFLKGLWRGSPPMWAVQSIVNLAILHWFFCVPLGVI